MNASGFESSCVRCINIMAITLKEGKMFEETEFLSRYGVTSGLPIHTDNLVAYAKREGLDPAQGNYLWAFLGDPDPSSNHRLYKRDHTDIWLRCAVPYSVTIQPYAASVNWPQAINEWGAFAEQHGLRYRVLPAGSGWYNPLRTACIEFTYAPGVRWDLPFFYEEIVEMREHSERYGRFH